MFTFTPRSATETRSLSTGTNKLIPNGTPLPLAAVKAALLREVKKVENRKLVPTGDQFVSATIIRLAVFKDEVYLGLAPSLSMFWSDREGNSGLRKGEAISNHILKGGDLEGDLNAVNQSMDMRFMVGLYDASGKVVSQYDDRPPLISDEVDASSDVFAKYRPTATDSSTQQERVGIGFINGYLKDEAGKYYKAADVTLQTSDKEAVLTFMNMMKDGLTFRAVTTPTAAVAEWLAASKAPTESEAESLFDF